MLEDIRACKEVGAHGIVIGALRTDGSIDRVVMQSFIEAARPMKVCHLDWNFS
jgi:copper homeostasis protein